MFSLLPTKIKIKIRPHYESNENILKCIYQIDDSPILHRVITALADMFSYKISSDVVKVTGDRITIQIPDLWRTIHIKSGMLK